MTGNEGAIGSHDGKNRNADYEWDKFDPEAYFHHYYGDPHPDDDRVTAAAALALRSGAPQGRLDIVDVGTGPNLIPFLAGLPRARTLTAWEYSPANIDWLRGELERPTLRPQWAHFWNVVTSAYAGETGLPADPSAALLAKASVVRGSIFDLPQERWDAATMFFCAESITQQFAEFEQACARFVGCVRPGGTLAAAFLVRSAGYDVAGRRFPALTLSPEDIESVFLKLAREVHIEPVGLVEAEVRSGYSGALFLNARR